MVIIHAPRSRVVCMKLDNAGRAKRCECVQMCNNMEWVLERIKCFELSLKLSLEDSCEGEGDKRRR